MATTTLTNSDKALADIIGARLIASTLVNVKAARRMDIVRHATAEATDMFDITDIEVARRIGALVAIRLTRSGY